jgi:pyruvate/2-oxoglutarate/acetoin dehydrogenase E1 component
MAMRRIRFIDAVREALAEEMRRDPSVVMFGEGIGPAGGSYKQTAGLFEEFGPMRVRDTPISELGFTTLSIGAAMAGLRPIVDIMFFDFVFEAIGELFDQAARIHYLSNGQFRVPMVVHGMMGAGRSAGAHHSSSPYPLFTHMPGLKVVVPSTPRDLKGLLKQAIRDDNPVMVFEHIGLYNTTGEVPELAADDTIAFGQAAIRRVGQDVTLVALAKMVLVALEAAEVLEREGLSVEVIDPRTLVPLDTATLLASIRKTGRLVIVDEAYGPCGIGAEIAALAAEEAFFDLDGPIRRIHTQSVPHPSSPTLEQAILPDLKKIVAAVREVMDRP